jgi:hypothetical protein
MAHHPRSAMVSSAWGSCRAAAFGSEEHSGKVKATQCTPCWTVLVERIGLVCNFSNCADIVFFACLTTTFWGTACLGKFVVPKIKGSFKSQKHVTIDHVLESVDKHGNAVRKFALPFTKTKQDSQPVVWAPQAGPLDLHAAFVWHVAMN